MGATVRYGLLALCVTLGACADLQTISRRTYLPNPTSQSHGVAIHLDAQQRLVLYGPNGRYCAEPSPDAMAAYAASLGLGASIPGTGAASAAQALQSSAASIGLRTQSITLMRDSLYRLCEAYANGELSDVSATMLLARSQDLTAVVVAVEQLTGAVAANQALLTSTAASSASAQLIANQQLLDAARKDEAEKEKNLADARTARAAQDLRVTGKTGDVATAQTAYDNAMKRVPKPSDSELGTLSAKLETEKQNLEAEQAKLKDAEGVVKRREELLAESKRVREIIQDNKDAALTQATASTGSAGQFSTPVQRVQLDKTATEKVAQSVTDMVKEVLNKDYTLDTCSTLLTSVPNQNLPEDAKQMLKETRVHCMVLMRAKIEAQTEKVVFGMDDSSDRINRALKAKPELRPALKTWLDTNAPGLDVPDLLIGRNAAVRRRAIGELRIP